MNTLSQQEFEALFDNAAIGIITVAEEGFIVMANKFALKQFGYQHQELHKKKIEVLLPSKLNDVHQQHRNEYIQNRPYSRPMGTGLDLCGVRKDGSEFPVEISLSTYTLNGMLYSIVFISDITLSNASKRELIRLNEELEQKNEELEQKVASRTRSLSEALNRAKDLNELKSRFVSMASHEFRTPLSTILSSTYLAEKYTTTEEQAQRNRHFQRIVSSVSMLTNILNDFLSVSKIEEGRMVARPVQTSIQTWMEDVLSELETMKLPGQKLHYRHNGGKEFFIDASLLKHIVQNLVSNAIKFSGPDGLIFVSSMITDQNFVLCVTDHGLGIPYKDQIHLFERFFRGTNADYIQGTGLGLHIVAKYAELMQGVVTFSSVEKEKTTFTVTFSKFASTDENGSFY